MFPNGTEVQTTEDNGSTDWNRSNPRQCQWGAEGVIVNIFTGQSKHTFGHGLCYLVRHKDGSKVWYEPEELELNEEERIANKNW